MTLIGRFRFDEVVPSNSDDEDLVGDAESKTDQGLTTPATVPQLLDDAFLAASFERPLRPSYLFSSLSVSQTPYPKNQELLSFRQIGLQRRFYLLDMSPEFSNPGSGVLLRATLNSFSFSLRVVLPLLAPFSSVLQFL